MNKTSFYPGVLQLELNKKNIKRILLIITFALVLYWVLHNIEQVGRMLSALLSVLSPLLIGLCLAFVLNLIMCPLERAWTKLFRRSKGRLCEKLRRPVCLTLSVLLFLGTISAVFFVLIPQIRTTVSGFSAKLPAAMAQLENWWNSISTFFAQHNIVLPILTLDTDQLIQSISSLLSEKGEYIFGKAADLTVSIVSAVVKTVLALIFSVYILAQKEKLAGSSRKLIYALVRADKADRFLRLTGLIGNTFSRFITGQVTDAFILGVLCFIGMAIFRLPYPLVISFVICFTALIPIFGAWIGAITGAFLIVFISPLKAFWFVVFLVILQQIEGNLIYPRIVGKSVGLPGLWVLAAVTIGGSAFGILGMLLGVPIFAVIYALVTEFVRSRDTGKI